MDYLLHRFSSQSDSTLGAFFRIMDGKPSFRCFSLEDEFREVKVEGETRIPAGRYEIKLRQAGKVHDKYKAKFTWHKGVLHLQDVPGFTWIYIHMGVHDDHTEGCVLAGDGVSQNVTRGGALMDSEAAYKRLYLEIVGLLDEGYRVFLDVRDYA